MSKIGKKHDITLNFCLADFRHAAGLHHITDIVIENNLIKTMDAILRSDFPEITDTKLNESRKYKEISHGNDESIKSDSISSRENRQTELEGQSKTIYNSNGNNVRSNTDNPRIIPVNKPNKVRAWDMER